jgi:glyoxylase-like metal-dependent hydrolase (beta-lactamase superfamily II)
MARTVAGNVAWIVLLLATTASAAETTAPATIEAQALRGGLHVLKGAGANVVAWTGSDGLLVVDTGNVASAPQLFEALAKVSPGPVRLVVNTHWHPDHVGGNAALRRAGAEIIAHDDTRARMTSRQLMSPYEVEVPAAPRDALPIVTFDDTLSLHLNGTRVLLVHVPAAHTDGDLVVWWESANVVHLGDAYYAGEYPAIDVANGGSLAGTVAAIETTLSRTDARTVIVPGHGPVSNRGDLMAYRDMLVAVGKRVRELVEQGNSLDEVLAARPTEAFDERYGQAGIGAERFVRLLYADLTARR